MAITNGQSKKYLVLYPLAQPLLVKDSLIWVEEEEEDDLNQTSMYPILTIIISLANKQSNEDTFISIFLQN
jgi:hypothetical protein